MTTLLEKTEILKQYTEMINCFDENVLHEFVDSVELNNGLNDCNGICFNGKAYLIGADNELKSHLVQCTYPKIENLTDTQKIKIIEYMGLDSDYINDITFTDVLITFGSVTDTIFSEK